ncbi:putative metalloendopeptidase [Enhygromyxa salina]|uniref:Putative metalloendopeptidase n=1 Tax=Enhygromyxa salina TaxID=215803 RepID=A0A0C2D2X2_9BACT|nr:M23 family metallopeptidase [Enhygromyxa salina]KIG17601.1 putative metalloendopeptidase [Enhygromyxa salina]
MRLARSATLALALALALGSTTCGGPDGDIVWPISGSAKPDADTIAAPFGPRDQSGKYDFHAGTDFPVPEGTKIHAIKAGEIEKVVDWDGKTGPGNWVLIDHGGGEKSAYLHMSKTSVKAGEFVEAGAVLGRSGSVGANSEHLHLNYMVGVQSNGADEAVARNVLELLPHGQMPPLEVTFSDTAVELRVPIQIMTIQTITVAGAGESRTLDYAGVLAMGNPDRDDPSQSGLTVAVTDADDGRFTLTLAVQAPSFIPTQVIVTDIDGESSTYQP